MDGANLPFYAACSGCVSAFWHPVKNMAAEDIVFYSSIPFIYRKFAYFLDDIIDGNRFINDELPKKNSGLSPVSISVGVAFTDRKKSSSFIFKDADKALYLALFIWQKKTADADVQSINVSFSLSFAPSWYKLGAFFLVQT